jgi:anti-sigma factor RsiW
MADLIVSYEELLDLVEGRLAADQAAQLQAKIAQHAPTQRELRTIQHLLELMRTDSSVEPPTHVVQRALRLFRPQAAPSLMAQLRRFVATLQFDSGQVPLAMGMRTGHTATRQMLFATDERTIDLRLHPERALWRLSGQVLGPDEPGMVELRGSEFNATATLNDLCEFVLPAIPAGRYSLLVRQGDLEIEIAGLEIQNA